MPDNVGRGPDDPGSDTMSENERAVPASEEVGLQQSLPTIADSATFLLPDSKVRLELVNIRPRWPKVPEGQERPRLEKEAVNLILKEAAEAAVNLVLGKTAQDKAVLFWAADPNEAYYHALSRIWREFHIPGVTFGLPRGDRYVIGFFTHAGEHYDWMRSVLLGLTLPERKIRKPRQGKGGDKAGATPA